MKKLILFTAFCGILFFPNQGTAKPKMEANSVNYKNKPGPYWKKSLPQDVHYICRQKGTLKKTLFAINFTGIPVEGINA